MSNLILVLTALLLFFPTQTLAQSSTTDVSASIGEYRFHLFGYTSPYALITLEGNGIFDQTIADKNGRFDFWNKFSPFQPREACLTARDQLGRLSQPTCLPPFPVKYNATIGPVPLPPTLSLDQPDYYVGDQVVLTGQSIPSSTVDLKFYTDDQFILNHFSLGIIRPAYAASLPLVGIRTDIEGNFSMTLPSSEASKYRFFTQVDLNDELSSKSLTLNVSILPIWMVIFNFLILIWRLIQPRFLEIVIALELFIVSWSIFHYWFHPHRVRALALRKPGTIVLFKNNNVSQKSNALSEAASHHPQLHSDSNLPPVKT